MRAATLLIGCCALWPTLSPAAAPAALDIDKAQQRRLQLRTVETVDRDSRAIAARVIANPRSLWRVSADQRGLVEPPERGFPNAGDRVEKGQLLAWLRPAVTDGQWRDLQGQQAAAQRQFEIADLKIHRFDMDVAQQIDIQLPTPSIQLIADYHGSEARRAVLDKALAHRVALKAPVSGRLLDTLAQSGGVALAGASLFEGLVETDAPASGLLVEVLCDAEALDTRAARQALRVDGSALALEFVGEAFDSTLRRQRVWYSASAPDLRVGELLRIELATRERQARLPRSSVFSFEGGRWVWVHESAERFVARAVSLAEADVSSVAVSAGLQPGDRVVADAGALLKRSGSR
jgi:hypothetical protein